MRSYIGADGKIGALRIRHREWLLGRRVGTVRVEAEVEQKAPILRSRQLQVTNRQVLATAIPMTLAYLTTPLLSIVHSAAAVGQFGNDMLLGGLGARQLSLMSSSRRSVYVLPS